MKEKAIEKINAEMQKNPDNQYIEIIGHYIIDKCNSEDAANKVMAEGKSLAGCLDQIKNIAREKAVNNVGVVSEQEAFGTVDKYFGFTEEQAKTKETVAIDLDKFFV